MGATLADGGVNPLTHASVAIRELPLHARGDGDRRACTRRPATGSTTSACRARAASAAASSPSRPARAGWAPSRRCSTRPATASRASSPPPSCRAGSASTSSPRSTCVRAARCSSRSWRSRCRRPRSPTGRRRRRSPQSTRRSCGSSRRHRACGPGEPYVPIDVDLLFDEPTVALRGPWNERRPRQDRARRAEDLARGLYEYHLDFPGNALDPGCDYQHWAAADHRGHAPAVYAHVATEPGSPGQARAAVLALLRLQRLEQPARGRLGDDPARLRRRRRRRRRSQRTPVEVGYSQHEGAERADWDDDKLELVDGTHPVVLPGRRLARELLRRGALPRQLGRAGRRLRRHARARRRPAPGRDDDPERPGRGAAARSRGSRFQGRWGELQQAFFNGPTGPNLKTQWTEPIHWSEGWRDRSYAVPAGGVVGTGATDFFCAAVAERLAGARAARCATRRRVRSAAAGARRCSRSSLLSRTTWRPAAPLRLGRRRSWGQILSAAARMYVGRPLLFLGIGLLLIPISLVVTVLQTLVLARLRRLGVETRTARAAGWSCWSPSRSARRSRSSASRSCRPRPPARSSRSTQARPTGPVAAYRLALAQVAAAARLRRSSSPCRVSLLATVVFLIPSPSGSPCRWALIARRRARGPARGRRRAPQRAASCAGAGRSRRSIVARRRARARRRAARRRAADPR